MQTAIYIRTSTIEQNPENQLKDCLSINKYSEHSVFEEQQSAWKDNLEKREQFKAILEGIKRRQIKHLIVWDLDRIYRNRKKLIEFFAYCKLYGCKIHSFRQGFLETIHTMPPPFDEAIHDFMLHIMGWIAEDDSKRKSDRVKAAVRRKDNHPTQSYKGNRWGRKSIITQKKNLIAEMLGQGKGIRNIARELGLSVGVVHKYSRQNARQETPNQETVL